MHQKAVPLSSRPVKVSARDLDFLRERHQLHWRGNTRYALFDGIVHPLDVVSIITRAR